MCEGVYGVAPVLDEDRTRWMAATLTTAQSVLSHASAAAAWGFRSCAREFEIITRPGSGGPRRFDGVLVCRSSTLAGNTATLDGIPITTPERTLIDLRRTSTTARSSARCARRSGWARPVRAPCSLRLRVIAAAAARAGCMRRSRATPASRCTGPRAMPRRWRSGCCATPGARYPNRTEIIAGEEADLSWPSRRLIVEIDGPQFHLDPAEDLRKQRIWEAAGWTVRRLPTDDVYLDPERLVALAAEPRALLVLARSRHTHRRRDRRGRAVDVRVRRRPVRERDAHHRVAVATPCRRASRCRRAGRRRSRPGWPRRRRRSARAPG